MWLFGALGIAVLLLVAAASGQQPSPDTKKVLVQTFDELHKKLLDMAEDFPMEKYSFRPTPETRSFAEVLVHVLSGVDYGAKAFKKAFADADAMLKNTPADRLAASPEPWLLVIEHSAEHYGQLVTYYRLNSLVPRESRPKK